jgi:hypothetical protein
MEDREDSGVFHLLRGQIKLVRNLTVTGRSQNVGLQDKRHSRIGAWVQREEDQPGQK